MPARGPRPGFRRRPPAASPSWAWSLVFFLGVLVAAALARAVLKLEAAAGRIAAGDFDTAVGVRGIKEIEDLAYAMDGMRATLKC